MALEEATDGKRRWALTAHACPRVAQDISKVESPPDVLSAILCPLRLFYPLATAPSSMNPHNAPTRMDAVPHKPSRLCLAAIGFALALLSATFSPTALGQQSGTADRCTEWSFTEGSGVIFKINTCANEYGESGYYLLDNMTAHEVDVCWTIYHNDGSTDPGCRTMKENQKGGRGSCFKCNPETSGVSGVTLRKFERVADANNDTRVRQEPARQDPTRQEQNSVDSRSAGTATPTSGSASGNGQTRTSLPRTRVSPETSSTSRPNAAQERFVREQLIRPAEAMRSAGSYEQAASNYMQAYEMTGEERYKRLAAQMRDEGEADRAQQAQVQAAGNQAADAIAGAIIQIARANERREQAAERAWEERSRRFAQARRDARPRYNKLKADLRRFATMHKNNGGLTENESSQAYAKYLEVESARREYRHESYEDLASYYLSNIQPQEDRIWTEWMGFRVGSAKSNKTKKNHQRVAVLARSARLSLGTNHDLYNRFKKIEDEYLVHVSRFGFRELNFMPIVDLSGGLGLRVNSMPYMRKGWHLELATTNVEFSNTIFCEGSKSECSGILGNVGLNFSAGYPNRIGLGITGGFDADANLAVGPQIDFMLGELGRIPLVYSVSVLIPVEEELRNEVEGVTRQSFGATFLF